MSLKKRKDGLYEKKVTLNGKRVTFYGKSEREIIQSIAAYREKDDIGLLFCDVAKSWWEQKEPLLAINSVNGYKAAYNCAAEWFGDTPLKDITPTTVRGFLDFLGHKGYAYKTVCNYLIVISSVFFYACENCNYTSNPASFVKIPKNLPRTKRLMPKPEEIEEIKKSRDTEDGLFFYFFLYTGLRLGEALALRWDDIDPVSNQISVTKSACFGNCNTAQTKDPKTEAGKRNVIYLEKLKDTLEPHRGKCNEFVFGKSTMLTKRKYQNLLNRYNKEHNFHVTPHQLRHAFATMCYEAGVDEKAAQGLLGHAQLSTTMDIYTELRKQKLMDVGNKLNEYDF